MTDISPLDQKINEVFPGCVVRKDLVKEVKGSSSLPSYVLEYLLGQYCATADEDSINSGIRIVREIIGKHYVNKNEAKLIQSNIREKGHQKVIDRISAVLNTKKDIYEASFMNLGITKVLLDSDTIRKNPKLLVTGIWCIADLEYNSRDSRDPDENSEESPWLLTALKPIQMSYSDLEGYRQGRQRFTTSEWTDLILQSMGLNPQAFSSRGKLLQILRLVPFCERNYNFIELGPKGTGKSHIFSEFSPHGMLLSGGEVTAAKLFVNNSTGQIGLVGYWDCVTFDEFAGAGKKVDKALVDIMKNYMANRTFSRGAETMGGEASMAFVGNTSHSVSYMLRNLDLFSDLPDKYHDTAFLDRLHAFSPGWETENLRQEMFSRGFGFVVDYFAEILRALRNEDYSGIIGEHFTLSSDISTRDRDGIRKTFSGLMKILHPSGEATPDEIRELLIMSAELRKRVKDQLIRIDPTFSRTSFTISPVDRPDDVVQVKTQEETEYPEFYYHQADDTNPEEENGSPPDTDQKREPWGREKSGQSDLKNLDGTPQNKGTAGKAGSEVEENHHEYALPTTSLTEIREDEKNRSFFSLVQPYLRGAEKIIITDPYVRNFFQQRNLMELLIGILKDNFPQREVSVHLITCCEMDEREDVFAKREENFRKMKASFEKYRLNFTWEYDSEYTIHDRKIETDTGWSLMLGRGLDVYQKFSTDAFDVEAYIPELRSCKQYTLTAVQKNPK